MVKEAKQTAKHAATESPRTVSGGSTDNNDTESFIRNIQELMWNKVGIVRTRQGLTEAIQQLQASAQQLPSFTTRRNCEARNIHTAGQLIARSALVRLESRGAHYRTDYSEHDDAKFRKHSIVAEKGVRFV
jgi:L-aspartate oxidase